MYNVSFVLMIQQTRLLWFKELKDLRFFPVVFWCCVVGACVSWETSLPRCGGAPNGKTPTGRIQTSPAKEVFRWTVSSILFISFTSFFHSFSFASLYLQYRNSLFFSLSISCTCTRPKVLTEEIQQCYTSWENNRDTWTVMQHEIHEKY